MDTTQSKDVYLLLVAGAVGAALWFVPLGAAPNIAAVEDDVLPQDGVMLPVVWGDLGKKLVESGIIDETKWKTLYESGLTAEERTLLTGNSAERLRITAGNAHYLLNLFWAFGLANKSPVLERGEMMDPRYGGPQNFASTGGWTLAKGDAMEHYSRHQLVSLTPEQEELVEKVSRGIYRPCCGNSTHFPDCNHGMAMLGLLELMASKNVPEREMWRAALAVNAYWFPDTYLTIAEYLKRQGKSWARMDPEELLGASYSSGPGYARIAEAMEGRRGGASCAI